MTSPSHRFIRRFLTHVRQLVTPPRLRVVRRAR